MNTMPLLINFAYVISAGLFIFGLKMLSSPATARRGNLVSALGMLLAIVVTPLAGAGRPEWAVGPSEKTCTESLQVRKSREVRQWTGHLLP